MSSQSRQDRPGLARRMIRASCREWCVWAFAWCVARGLLLVSFADVFGYGEELKKACAGKAMLDGLLIPHYQLAYHYYEGGGFVVSHLDALAFALLGESLLAVKLVALGFGAAILGAGWRLCERLGGRGTARVFATLFIFAPASEQKLSLLALGTHFQAMLFVALVLDATLQIILEHDLRPRSWLRLGLWSGFGLFFSYQLVLTIAVVAIALAIALRADVLRKATWFGLMGFAIGLLPLAWMAAHVGMAVFDIHGADVVGEGGAAKLDTLREFCVSVFAGRSALDEIGLIALCASPLLGFLALLPSSERGLRVGAWIVLAHMALFLFAYIASSFTVGRVYHYFVLNRLTPLWWLAAAFTALGVIAAWKSRRRWQQSLACIFVAALSICGAVDLHDMLRDAWAPQTKLDFTKLAGENLKILARTKGYTYPEYLTKIAAHLQGTSADKLRAFLRFRELPEQDSAPPSTLLHEGIAVALYGDGSHTLEQIQRELSDSGIEDPRGFYLGLGSFMRVKFPHDIAMRVRAVETEPPKIRDALIEGVGCSGLGMLATEDRVAREVQLGLDAKLPRAYFAGLGRRMHDAFGNLTLEHYFEMTAGPWMLERERAEEFALSQPKPVADSLLAGYRAAQRDRWLTPEPWWLWKY